MHPNALDIKENDCNL